VNHVVLIRVAADEVSVLQGTYRISRVSTVLITAARKFGTPTYVIDMQAVSDAARQLEAAFRAPWVLQYSLKANDLPAISSYLRSRGWGANVVSTGEWQFARRGGMRNAALTFEGIGKTDAQLEYAVIEAARGRPLRWLAVESAEEAERLALLARLHRLGRDGTAPLDVLLRLNPEVHPETRPEFAVGQAASKFGMPAREILDLVRSGLIDGSGLRLRGIHVHAGSDLRDVAAWANAGVRATRLLHELAGYAAQADTVDYGGGFPLSAEDAPSAARFRTALLRALDDAGLALPARPAIEPGRYLVGGAGWLVAGVLHARRAHDRNGKAQAVLDAGMTEFIRPALYGTRHPVYALPPDRGAAGELCSTSVEGPVCESTDTFGVHQLPQVRRGDLVAIENAGAYAASFTSRYNGRPAPAEVLLWPDGSLERCHRPELLALEHDSCHALTEADVPQSPISQLRSPTSAAATKEYPQ
jgi:diaminopimelate decarboxylase